MTKSVHPLACPNPRPPGSESLGPRQTSQGDRYQRQPRQDGRYFVSERRGFGAPDSGDRP